MVKLAHISDLHFGHADPSAVTSLHESLTGLQPDLVVVSGDLTQSGRRREFDEAAEFLTGLGIPFFCVPGNHDTPVFNLPLRFFDPWSRFQTRFGSADVRTVVVGDASVIGVNSARRAAPRLNWSYGRLSPRRAEEVCRAARQETAEGRTVLVACHHPFETGNNRAGAETVKGAESAASAFAAAGVNAVLTGHVHVSAAAPLASAEGRLLSIRCGTSTSTRGRGEEPAYNLISVERDEISVEIRKFDSTKFELAEIRQFARQGGVWRLGQ